MWRPDHSVYTKPFRFFTGLFFSRESVIGRLERTISIIVVGRQRSRVFRDKTPGGGDVGAYTYTFGRFRFTIQFIDGYLQSIYISMYLYNNDNNDNNNSWTRCKTGVKKTGEWLRWSSSRRAQTVWRPGNKRNRCVTLYTININYKVPSCAVDHRKEVTKDFYGWLTHIYINIYTCVYSMYTYTVEEGQTGRGRGEKIIKNNNHNKPYNNCSRLFYNREHWYGYWKSNAAFKKKSVRCHGFRVK